MIIDSRYPYPPSTNVTSKDSDKIKLFCHPSSKIGERNMNVVGRNSFVTGFGPMAREDFDEKVRLASSLCQI